MQHKSAFRFLLSVCGTGDWKGYGQRNVNKLGNLPWEKKGWTHWFKFKSNHKRIDMIVMHFLVRKLSKQHNLLILMVPISRDHHQYTVIVLCFQMPVVCFR